MESWWKLDLVHPWGKQTFWATEWHHLLNACDSQWSGRTLYGGIILNALIVDKLRCICAYLNVLKTSHCHLASASSRLCVRVCVQVYMYVSAHINGPKYVPHILFSSGCRHCPSHVWCLTSLLGGCPFLNGTHHSQAYVIKDVWLENWFGGHLDRCFT